MKMMNVILSASIAVLWAVDALVAAVADVPFTLDYGRMRAQCPRDAENCLVMAAGGYCHVGHCKL